MADAGSTDTIRPGAAPISGEEEQMTTLALALVLAQTAVVTPGPAPRTTAPAASPTPAATPAAPRRLSGGFGQKPVSAGKGRVVIDEESLGSQRRGGTFSVVGSAPAARPTAGAPPAGSPAAPPDEEATWRSRVATLRADLAQAEKDYDAADRSNTVVSFGRPGVEYETLMAIRNAALTPYRMKLDEVRSSLAALPEECRKTSGCQPGWVR